MRAFGPGAVCDQSLHAMDYLERAAERAGDAANARRYYQRLADLCATADAERPELKVARQALGNN